MNKILIVKNSNAIIISQNGKRLIIDNSNKLFNQLTGLSKDEIRNWYLNR